MANAAPVFVVLLQALTFDLTLQATKSAKFAVNAGFVYPENETWSNVEMTDVHCASLATMAEADGFNMKKTNGMKSMGRCQIIPTVSSTSLLTASDYTFYSTLGKIMNAEVDYCASDICLNATRRFVTVEQDPNTYLDCGDRGSQCIVLHCGTDLIFDEAQNTCVPDCWSICHSAAVRLNPISDSTKYLDCGDPIGSLCIIFTCPSGLIFNVTGQICDWP